MVEFSPQPESRQWACALNAFAVASGFGAHYLEATIGHDGSDIIDESFNDCRRFAGFTDSEIIRALWLMGVAVVSINFEDLTHEKRITWRNLIGNHAHVIYFEGETGLHAVAAKGKRVIDIRKDGIKEITEIHVDKIAAIYIVIRDMECRTLTGPKPNIV